MDQILAVFLSTASTKLNLGPIFVLIKSTINCILIKRLYISLPFCEKPLFQRFYESIFVLNVFKFERSETAQNNVDVVAS